jgi:hypothetical protein
MARFARKGIEPVVHRPPDPLPAVDVRVCQVRAERGDLNRAASQGVGGEHSVASAEDIGETEKMVGCWARLRGYDVAKMSLDG